MSHSTQKTSESEKAVGEELGGLKTESSKMKIKFFGKLLTIPTNIFGKLGQEKRQKTKLTT